MKSTSVMAGTYHHGNLRQALLDQALASLRKRGAENLSLRDLARAIGVSQAAPYRHFPDKDSLLAQLATLGYRELGRAMRAALGQARSDGTSGLQAAGVSYVQFALRHPEQYRLMFGSYRIDQARHVELVRAANDAYSVLLETVREGVDSAELTDEPVEIVAAAAWSIVHGLASLIIDERLGAKSSREATAIAERVTGLLIDGLARRTPGSHGKPVAGKLTRSKHSTD
jgi:AcrR family transcriptional regulator